MPIFSNPEQMARHLASSRRVKLGAFLLRFLAFVLCAAAVIAMVTSRQHKSTPVPIPGFRNNNIRFEKTADYGYSKAFSYIITAATISAAYALLQGARSLTSLYLGFETGGECLSWFTLLGDQVMTYLLLAAGAASTEVVYVGEKGLRTVTWVALCVIFSKFCKHVIASIIFTFLATIVFSISTILSAYELFHRYG